MSGRHMLNNELRLALFDKTEIRSEGLNLIRRQAACNSRHWKLCSRIESFAPLLKPPFQVIIRQPSQTRYLPNALSIRAMTSNARHDVGLRNAILIDCCAYGGELPETVIGSFRRYRGKINRQIMRRLRTEIRCGPPHILSRKWIVSRVLAKAHELIFDVLVTLSGQSWCRRVALGRSSMAPVAILNRQTLRVPRPRGTSA